MQGSFFTKEEKMDIQKDILYQAASVWKELTEYSYIFTFGYKKQLHTIHLIFSLEDFPHLAGFQYLKDISLPRYNSRKIVDKILDNKITNNQINKGIQYTNMVEPRLKALVRLKEILENDFRLFSYMPKMYPFTTTIKADYIISSQFHSDNFVFIIKSSCSDITKCNYLCCSAFAKGERDYETNQRFRTLLKKERIHKETNNSIILYNKLT